MYNLPKSYLVSTIISHMDFNDIRKAFSIQDDTDLKSRLYSFSKSSLINYIENVGGVLKKQAETNIEMFLLKAAPTLYVINIANTINFEDIRQKTNALVLSGRESALEFPESRSIRAVYFRSFINSVTSSPKVYETTLGYEKKIEITEWNPDEEDYAESKIIFSLENALVWFPAKFSHYGVIACSDFSAINPLIKYLNYHFGIGISLPDLTYNMLVNIAEGGNIRNATFTNVYKDKDSELDIQTITMFDDNLSESKTYFKISSQPGKEQRSGFYTNHPDILRAGIGIARRYGRIWTPAHLNRDELIKLSIGVISKLDKQLQKASKSNLEDFITYYSNTPVVIGKTLLSGESRKLFDKIVYYIVKAQNNKNRKYNIPNNVLPEIIKHKTALKISIHITLQCPNCGETNAICPLCGSTIELRWRKDKLQMECSKCKVIIDGADHKCDCGEMVPIIDPLSQSVIIPEIELLEALDIYAELLHPSLEMAKLFLISGYDLITFNQASNAKSRRIHLDELEFWKKRAHIHQITSTIEASDKILNKMREKCKRTIYHPKEEDCIECFKKQFTIKELEDSEICLLRVFGIPIEEKFDGIHHGHEGADIKYTDYLDDTKVKIGLHVKSKTTDRTAFGLGRSKPKVKELYAQVFYSLYKISIKKEEYDILGFAIPNRISPDVITSMQYVLDRYGISLLVVDKTEWDKIITRAAELIQFNY